MKKFLLNSTIVLAGILLGAGTGAFITFATYSQHYPVVRAFSWMQIGLAVSENAFDSNSTNAKKDLSNTLYMLDRNSESPRVDAAMKNALRMECGRLEAQLSILEKEAGNNDQSAFYMSKARKDLKAAGWIDVSEGNILRTFGRQPISPCGSSSPSTTKNAAPTEKPCGKAT